MTPFAGVDMVTLLTRAMSVAEMNHKLIAQNIANADTPNYNAVSLDFQKTLDAALDGRLRASLRRTDERHIEATRVMPRIQRLAKLSKNDYNKVDLDEEMTRLSENTGRYTRYGSLLIKQFRGMRDMLSNIR